MPWIWCPYQPGLHVFCLFVVLSNIWQGYLFSICPRMWLYWRTGWGVLHLWSSSSLSGPFPGFGTLTYRSADCYSYLSCGDTCQIRMWYINGKEYSNNGVKLPQLTNIRKKFSIPPSHPHSLWPFIQSNIIVVYVNISMSQKPILIKLFAIYKSICFQIDIFMAFC